jgi:hypothetical protein
MKLRPPVSLRYLARKWTGLKVARHFLTQRCAHARDDDAAAAGEPSAVSEFFGMTFTAVRAPLGSRAFFAFRLLSVGVARARAGSLRARGSPGGRS